MTKAALSEKQVFEGVFDQISADLIDSLSEYRLPVDGVEYVKKMLHYTAVGGKMNRGMTVLSSLKSLSKIPISDNQIFRAQVLGWCIELLQAFFLVADDIMDGSKTRRGAPCWYKLENVGMIAINDSFILESFIYKLLKKHFRQESYYVDLLDLFHEVTYQTELGQLMDLITAPEDSVDLSKFSIEKHAYIVEYKTAYYSFYLPVAAAMRMAGITEEKLYKDALAILLPLGEYFQVQDDYLDCYGDPGVIGKIGTDIQDNKCSWLINQALKLANDSQLKLLQENYGQKDSAKEAIVKQVFKELNLQQVYLSYEESSYSRISELIEKLDSKLPKEMFITFMNRIYKRKL